MSRHMSRARRGGDGGTHWISYSDMMCSLLLMFILAITLCIYHYYTLLDQVGEQQAQLEAAQITLSQKEKDLENTRVELMGKEEDLAAIQIQLDTKEQDLNAAQVKLSEREAENERLLAALENLSDADLNLVTMYAYEGYTVTEISKVLGVAQPTISIKIKRITKFLKNFNFNAMD